MPRGIFKRTEEYKAKLRKASRHGRPRLGMKNSPESNLKRSIALKKQWKLGVRKSGMLGKHHSQEAKEKIRKATTRQMSNLENRLKLSIARQEDKGSNWKGLEVGYGGLHTWVKKHLGKPKYCEHCKRTDKKKYEWANKSHQYKRELTDWLRLCTSCHLKYDRF